MSVINTIVKEKKHVKRSDGYHPVSQWTSSDTVEMPNGKTLSENRVELTQAEYDALPDTKLTDGVDYFITDGEGGGGSSVVVDSTLTVEGAAADAKAVGDVLAGISSPINSINMYYDPETDIEYKKNQDGEWVEVEKVGLLKSYFYNNGIAYKDLVTTVGGSGSSGTTVLETDHILVTATGDSANGRRQGIRIKDSVDLTNISTLWLDYEVTNGNQNVLVSITINTSINDASFYDNANAKKIANNLSTGAKGTIALDVSSVSGSYYIYAGVVSSGSGTQTKFNKISYM